MAFALTWFPLRRWVRGDGAWGTLLAVVAGAWVVHLGCGIQAHGVRDGLQHTMVRVNEYWQDVRFVHAGFLASFPEVGELSLHGSTHPPGLTLLLAGLGRLGCSSPVAATLVCSLASSLAAFPLYGAARRLADERSARWAVALFSFACSVTAFSVLAMDTVTMGFAALALYGFARALDGEWRGGAVLGLALAAATLCNFIALTLPATFAVLLLARRRELDRRRLQALGTAALLFVAAHALLVLGFGYRPVHVFAACHRAFLGSEGALRSGGLALLGNPVALLGSLGLPLAGLTARSVGGSFFRRRDRQTVALVLAAILPGVLCSVAATPPGEVEHIFLLYVPSLMLAIGATASRWYDRSPAWVSDLAVPLLVAQSILIETFFETFW